jgi:hypothetical protein
VYVKGNELVWRSLADAAFREQRRWSNVADLAFSSGVPDSTANLALERLKEIGAIARYPRGGFSLISLDKVLTVLSAWRNLAKDTIALTTLDAIAPYLHQEKGPYALGGPDAATAILGGAHVADFVQHLVYLPIDPALGQLPPGQEVRVLSMDHRAVLDWTGYSSVAQTYADLFATPGWAASEYRYAIRDKFLREREWDQVNEVA